jgi:putative hydrolase of the HAD superfamily
MAIKAIFFDFFGVISIPSQHLFFETAIPRYHQRHAEFEELGRRHELGLISTEQYLATISTETGQSVQSCLKQMHSERKVNKPLLQYIEQKLRSRYRLAIFSNAGGDLSGYIDKDTLNKTFDDVIISAAIGAAKPDPQAFAIACQRLHVDPDEALLIDDIAANCDGAKAAGWKAVLYKSNPQLFEDLHQAID